MLVLAALIFGQFASVSHAHDAHDDVPVACDVCISAVSEDDDDAVNLDSDPQPTPLDLDAIPASLTLKDDPSVPVFVATQDVSVLSDEGRAQPRQTRAPPL